MLLRSRFRVRRPAGRVVRAALLASVAFVVPSACSDSAAPKVPVEVTLTIMSGDNQGGEVATVLRGLLVVRVSDVLGAPLSGIVVRYEHVGGAQSISAASDANGLVMARWTLAERAGVETIRASAVQPNVSQPVEFTAIAVAAPPAQIQAGGEGLYAAGGSQLDTLRAFVRDRFGNFTPFVPISWSVTPGEGSVRSLSATTDAIGSARAVWTLGESERPQTLSVSSGSATTVLVATAAPALVARQVVTGSDHSCALIENGVAYCWGANHFGQLGIGIGGYDERSHTIPLAVIGGVTFQSLVAGALHTCGLTAAGTTYCWGSNYSGQVGAAINEPFPVPTVVAGAPKFSKLVAGSFHTCGLTSGGDVYCWGDNSVGQAGDGSNRSIAERYAGSPHPVPTRVVGSIAFSSIAAAHFSTCGLSTTGEVHCWGENSMAELGRVVDGRCRTFYEDYPDIHVEGDNPCSTSPVRVVTAGAVASLAGSGLGMCAVLASRGLQCWGFGELPNVVPNAAVDEAWVLWSSVCGLETGGAVKCWRLPRPIETPRPFGDNLTLVNFATSGRHTCGLTPGAAGKVYCWGSNFSGALGDGTTRHREYPAAVVKPPTSGSR